MTATPPLNDPVRVGIVGCGFVTLRHHLPALASLAGSSACVVSLADSDPKARSLAAANAPGASLHDSAHGLLADERVEAVAICTPAGSHAEIAIAALESGRHVLVEKPLTLDLAEADRLVAAGERSGLVAGVGFKYRRHRLVAQATEIVRSGVLGPLRLIETTFTSDSRTSAERSNAWRGDRGRGGGAILEQAVHHADFWRLLSGAEVERVSALAADGDATAVISAELTGGVIAATVACDAAGFNHDVRVHGRDATLAVRLDRFDGLEVIPSGELPGDPLRRLSRGARLVRSIPAMARSHRAGGDITAADSEQWRAFAAAARGAESFSPSLADGRAALAIALAAIESADSGSVVVPLAAPGSRVIA